MARLILHRILLLGSVLAFANAAKCSRTRNAIKCENADAGVIRRLAINYENDVSLIAKNSSVSVLESGMFEDLKFVEKLSLSRCGIRIIKDDAFRGLNLTHLNLARNFIRHVPNNVFSSLPELKFLDLSHNLISRLELSSAVDFLPKLSYVDVSNNRLKNLTFIGNFSELETINFENNTLVEFQIHSVMHFPKMKEVFLDGNSFNESYESSSTFILMSCRIKIDFENPLFDDEWNHLANRTNRGIFNNSTSAGRNSKRLSSFQSDFEKDFNLSPDLIKSLNTSQLTNFVQQILTLRNFTLNERRMLELDRKRIQDESRSVKNELTRIDQIIKRYKEVSGQAKEESAGEYIEKSCKGMPEDGWWKRFKKWQCKKLFNWGKRLIGSK